MAQSSPEVFRIRLVVHADTLCPWCYIEKRSLEASMKRFREKHPRVEFEVTWKPFYINPSLNAGCEKKVLYERMCGGPDKFPAFHSRIQAAGSRNGITFKLGGKTGSSRDSHKLIALANRRLGLAAQNAVVEQLFKGHFEGGRDVSDAAWLRQIGVEDVGLSEAVVESELASAEAGRMVDEEVRTAREDDGVGAVPCVTIQGRLRLGGYQEGDVFEKQFEKILSEKGA